MVMEIVYHLMCYAETTVVAENKLVVLPGDDSILSHASLTCFITPEGSNSRWITPDGASVLSIQHHEHYALTQGSIATISGEMIYGSILIIRDISYKNEGIYVCEVLAEEDCSDFPQFAIIHLVLKSECEHSRHYHASTFIQRVISI